ncbi:MAG TPA: hypothetical protein VMU54_22205, partial [Planctomycetota bacterium]|nr:hypothetical protein [Planctomycetota bacterium]
AYFGAGLKWTDVSTKIRGKVTDPFEAISTSVCGMDPLPGKVKTLVVIFEFRGRCYCRWVTEGFTTPLLTQ